MQTKRKIIRIVPQELGSIMELKGTQTESFFEKLECASVPKGIIYYRSVKGEIVYVVKGEHGKVEKL